RAERGRQLPEGGALAAPALERRERERRTRQQLHGRHATADLAAARHDTHLRRIAHRLPPRGLATPAQCLDVGRRPREQPQRRQALRELLRLTIELEHRLERGERHLVHAQRTLEVVAFDFFYELVAPDDDAGLRPAEELVAAEGHEISAMCQRLLRGRFFRQSILAQIHQRAAAQVHHEWQPPGVRKRREFLFGHHRGETLDRIVAGVHLHEQRTARADGLLEIDEMGAIGGADLAQAAARARHDRRNAERSADFDELAARDDHLLARRERSEHQQYRGGVVVHHRGGLSAGEFGEQRFDRGVAAPSSMAWRISESRERMAWTTAVWLYCAASACTAGIWSTRSTAGNTAAVCGFCAWTKDSSAYSVNTNAHLQCVYRVTYFLLT